MGFPLVSCSFILVAVAFVIFWASQLYDLMCRKDDEFPGRNDKVLWVLILILLPVIGVVLYWFWKPFPKGNATARPNPNATVKARARPWSDNEISPEPPKV